MNASTTMEAGAARAEPRGPAAPGESGGQSLLEYTLILSFIAVAAVAGATLLGGAVGGLIASCAGSF